MSESLNRKIEGFTFSSFFLKNFILLHRNKRLRFLFEIAIYNSSPYQDLYHIIVNMRQNKVEEDKK